MIAFIFFPISIFPIVYIGLRLRRVSAETQAELGLLTALPDDVFKDVRQVKTYGMENNEQSRADSMFESTFRFILKAARVRARSYPIMETLGGMAIAGFLFYGGYQVLHGETTVAKLIAFLTAMVTAFQPMRSLANLYASLHEGLAAAQRIFTIIDADQIYVLDRGQMVEQGTHVELLARNSLYTELTHMQLASDDEVEPDTI